MSIYQVLSIYEETRLAGAGEDHNSSSSMRPVSDIARMGEEKHLRILMLILLDPEEVPVVDHGVPSLDEEEEAKVGDPHINLGTRDRAQAEDTAIAALALAEEELGLEVGTRP